jgi:hypothetical protein
VSYPRGTWFELNKKQWIKKALKGIGSIKILKD